VIDFTPALRTQALENLKRYLWQPTPYIAPQLPNGQILGAINVGNLVGGINWPGASFDPETAIFYGQAHNSAVTVSSISETYAQTVKPETQREGRGPIWDPDAVSPARGAARGRGTATAAATARGAATAEGTATRGAGERGATTTAAAAAALAAAAGGRAGLTTGLEGLPIAKPPYGVLTAIDLNTRLGVNYSEKTGQPGSVGLMVTRTVVVVGDPQVTAPPDRPRGAMLRAYDKQTGKEVGAVLMPSQQVGSPMTYLADGRQYIVVAVQGTGGAGGQYIAYALPPGTR
jgi:quinoprotein glucose dehydrogenase